MYSEIVSFLGWVGVICCTLGYVLVSLQYVASNNWKYQLLNALGGLLLVVSALYNHDTPNIVANGLWALIGIVSLLKFSLSHPIKKVSTKH